MQKRKKFNISNFFKKSNVKRFLVFVIIASVFLVFSKLTNTYKQNIKLKVNLTEIDNEIVMENDSLNYISVYVEANGFALIPWVFKFSKNLNLNAKEDVVKEANQFVFDIEKHKYLIAEQLGKSYKVISVKPNQLILPYSKMATKFVPVNLKSEIEFASGFDLLDELSLSVDSIKIVGSSKEIDSITSFNTEILKLEAIKTDLKQSVYIDVSNYKNIDVFPKSIIVKGSVKRFTEGTVEVPITILNKPSDVAINYFPKLLNVVYYVDLERFKSIKSSDFAIVCDYSALQENQSFLTPEIVRQPNFIKRVKLKQNRIDFIKL